MAEIDNKIIGKKMLSDAVKIFLLFILPLVIVETSSGAFPKITAEIDKLRTTIGSPVNYTVAITGEEAGDFNFKMPERGKFFPEKQSDAKMMNKDDEPDGTEAVPLYSIQDVKQKKLLSGDGPGHSLELTIVYYRTGKYPLPEIEIIDSNKSRTGYRVPEIEIEAVNKIGEFRDIEPPLQFHGPYFFLIIALGVLLSAALLVFLFRYVLKKQKLHSHVPERTIDPLDDFNRAVDLLKSKKYIEKGEINKFVEEISRIFRVYLSVALKIDAMEMTVTEIIDSIENNLTSSTYKRMEAEITEILNLWDLKKFAAFAPSDEALKNNLNTTVSVAKRLYHGAGVVRY